MAGFPSIPTMSLRILLQCRETDLAKEESGSRSGPKPLPLVYLDASLSSFTKKPHVQKKSKQVHETKQTTQLTQPPNALYSDSYCNALEHSYEWPKNLRADRNLKSILH